MGNIFTVLLPDIGEGVVEGEVVEWLKEVGASLSQDEPVVVVMTDKATVELPAPYPGILAKQYVQVGGVARKDKPLYDIERGGERESVEKKKEGIKEEKREKLVEKSYNVPLSSGKVLATPAVRHIARQMEVDISRVVGSGKEGRILAHDLAGGLQERGEEREKGAGKIEGDEEIPLMGIRGAMAKTMTESMRTIPHFSYFEAVEVSRLLKLRESFKREGDKEGLHVTFLPFFIRALSLTIKKYPQLNASVHEGVLRLHKPHNIGVAMSTSDGLIVPVIKNAEEHSLEELIRIYEEMKERALAKGLSPEEMRGGTITLSNYGVFGGSGLWATPIIPPSQVAILAVNKIQRLPWIDSRVGSRVDLRVLPEEKQVEGRGEKREELIVGQVLHLSWSFDHRVIDGDLAAHVSHDFARCLENPASLL